MNTLDRLSRPLRVLLTGGGTGGHLFPAVATAETVVSRNPASTILFIGTKRRLDREQLAAVGFSVRTIHSYGLKGKRPLELLKALAVLPISVAEACWYILRFRPDVVCGVGGYVTGPVVAAAWLLRRPAVIHEQNSVPGLANRVLGRLASRVCISLPASERWFPPGKTVLTGNPVRRAIVDAAAVREQRPTSGKTLLVLGGSQGAHRVNELVTEALVSRAADMTGIRVIHQTGRSDADTVRERYRHAGIDAEVAPFFTDMASRYLAADLAVSRAGATSLAEISVLGLPAVLIPYPSAADDHQYHNARWYADKGGALLFRQEELTGPRLAAELFGLLADEPRRQEMARAMRRLGIGDAAERIVDFGLCAVIR